MSQFVETLKDVLIEKNMTIKDLSKYLTIPERTLYDIKNYNPTIKTVLKIVYYFSSSLDYFEQKHDIFLCNYIKNYKILFYENLIYQIKKQNLSQTKLCHDINISISCFKRWKHGVLPNYDNLITICNYLDCSIDEILGRKYSFKFEVS